MGATKRERGVAWLSLLVLLVLLGIAAGGLWYAKTVLDEREALAIDEADDGIALTVVALERGALWTVDPGDALPLETDELRFHVELAEDCPRLFVFSLDAKGTVRKLLPRDGDEIGQPARAGKVAVPGGFEFRPANGLLRFYAVCASAEIRSPHVHAALLDAEEYGEGGEDTVVQAFPLELLPDDTLQATRLVSWAKRPQGEAQVIAIPIPGVC
jgi:hypothetical protein